MIKNLIKTSLLISIFSLWSPLPSFSMQLTDLDVVSSFRKMPPEILGNIFRHLDRDSLINVSKVNQFFHASLLLNERDQKLSQVFVDNLNEKLETLQNLHVLILDNVTSDDINDKCLPKYLADILAKASTSCPSLEILSISNISFHKSSFGDVQTLVNSQPKQENHSSSFPPIHIGTPLLSEGEQRHFGGLLKELARPIRKWQNLRILRMAYTYQNDYYWFPIVELLNSLPESLEELDLRGSEFNPGDLTFLGNEEGLPFANNLRVLKLEDPVIDSVENLAYFLCCTRLEELTLIRTKNDASFFIELLEKLKKYAISDSLIKLDISDNKGIGLQKGNKKGAGNSLFCDEWMLLSNIFYFKNIQYLDIKKNGIKANFIDGFIEELLDKKLPNLQYIGCIDGNDIFLKKPKNIKDDYEDFLSGHNFECDEIPVKLPSEYNKIICKLEKLQGERNGFSFD